MRSRPRPPARPPTRVPLVSAHAPYRETMHQLLELEDDLTVVGEAATVAAALALAPEVRAEVVLTELPLPDGGGLALARALRTSAPPVAVLLLTLFDEEVVAAPAARAGVRAVLAKTAPARELVAAVRGAARPARAVAPPPVRVAPARRARPTAPPPAGA